MSAPKEMPDVERQSIAEAMVRAVSIMVRMAGGQRADVPLVVLHALISAAQEGVLPTHQRQAFVHLREMTKHAFDDVIERFDKAQRERATKEEGGAA